MDEERKWADFAEAAAPGHFSEAQIYTEAPSEKLHSF
jgi:hypothetical protein